MLITVTSKTVHDDTGEQPITDKIKQPKVGFNNMFYSNVL